MKNLFIITLAFVTLQATAQESKKGEMKEQMEKRQAISPEDQAKLQTKKLTLHLDLNDKQQRDIESILLTEAKSRKGKMEAFKAKKENGEKPSSEELVKMKNERLDKQIALKKNMKSILNPEQFEKWEKMQTKRGEKSGKRKRTRTHKQ